MKKKQHDLLIHHFKMGGSLNTATKELFDTFITIVYQTGPHNGVLFFNINLFFHNVPGDHTPLNVQ